MRTAIGRDPSCDIVIDNAGVSRLHAVVEAIGDSFVVRDCDSENGLTLNGEPCREGRLVHGDLIGLNKFLIRFSNQELEAPANLGLEPARPRPDRPKEVQRTMHLDSTSAQALAELAKQQVARQRAALAANGGDSVPPVQRAEPPKRTRPPNGEEASASRPALSTYVALLVGGALLALLLFVLF